MATVEAARFLHEGETDIWSTAALRMAEVKAGAFLDEEDEFGVVAVGARADLILVEGHPLRDL
jgi:imidazolonepropionase-like amidohydrolase